MNIRPGDSPGFFVSFRVTGAIRGYDFLIALIGLNVRRDDNHEPPQSHEKTRKESVESEFFGSRPGGNLVQKSVKAVQKS